MKSVNFPMAEALNTYARYSLQLMTPRLENVGGCSEMLQQLPGHHIAHLWNER